MGSLRGMLVRIAIFLVACLLAWALMVAEFGQIRFGGESTYKAVFSHVSGLEAGNFVRIAGVEVGKVNPLRCRTTARFLWTSPSTTRSC